VFFRGRAIVQHLDGHSSRRKCQCPRLISWSTRANQVSLECNDPLPTPGKMKLFDGKTGDAFDQPVTVGVITIMKLAHLVEDKVHA
jgi:DNA-directed RNA polymerase beta subunit